MAPVTPTDLGFSLVGGPLRPLLLRTRWFAHLSRHPKARLVAAAAVTWGVLLVLSLVEGRALPGAGARVPFLYDIAAMGRYLVALPVLLAVEPFIEDGLHLVVSGLARSELIADADRPALTATLDHVRALRDATLPTVVVILLAFAPYGPFGGGRLGDLHTPEWAAVAGAGGTHLTAAGWWQVFACMALFRFVLYRWLWRLWLWSSVMWRVGHFRLRLVPTHPDGAGGLGFIAIGQVRFSVLFFAIGAVVASAIGNGVAWRGQHVGDFQMLLVAHFGLALVLVLGPLLLLSRPLARARWGGLYDYGALAEEYAMGFDRKWVRHRSATKEPLLGSQDIQALADLGNAFGFVSQMRIAIFDRHTVILVVAAAGAPIVPLLLLATPAENIIRALLKIVA